MRVTLVKISGNEHQKMLWNKATQTTTYTFDKILRC